MDSNPGICSISTSEGDEVKLLIEGTTLSQRMNYKVAGKVGFEIKFHDKMEGDEAIAKKAELEDSRTDPKGQWDCQKYDVFEVEIRSMDGQPELTKKDERQEEWLEFNFRLVYVGDNIVKNALTFDVFDSTQNPKSLGKCSESVLHVNKMEVSDSDRDISSKVEYSAFCVETKRKMIKFRGLEVFESEKHKQFRTYRFGVTFHKLIARAKANVNN